MFHCLSKKMWICHLLHQKHVSKNDSVCIPVHASQNVHIRHEEINSNTMSIVPIAHMFLFHERNVNFCLKRNTLHLARLFDLIEIPHPYSCCYHTTHWTICSILNFKITLGHLIALSYTCLTLWTLLGSIRMLIEWMS